MGRVGGSTSSILSFQKCEVADLLLHQLHLPIENLLYFWSELLQGCLYIGSLLDLIIP